MIVTVNPFDALRIVSLGETCVVSLLAKSMTNEQEEELKKYKQILLLHSEPMNIVSRLSCYSFIKTLKLAKAISEMPNHEIESMLSLKA